MINNLLNELPARFTSKMDVCESSGCWIWKACKTWDGYGRILRGKTVIPAHRFSYEKFFGEVPNGFELDHKCRNRSCVNPLHLEAVTHKENMLRGLGVGSENAAKTSCINGHQLTTDNTYIRPNGNRDCRQCIRDRVKKYKKGRTA
jgi:hypothetical protein